MTMVYHGDPSTYHMVTSTYHDHGDPWCARLFLSVSIRLEMRTLAWQILGQNFRIDTTALLNGIASKRAKACSHCAAL